MAAVREFIDACGACLGRLGLALRRSGTAGGRALALTVALTLQVGAPRASEVQGGASGGRGHWSLQPVRNPAVPGVTSDGAVVSPIDAFIRTRLAERGLEPAPEADRATLIRRLSFDLTGLPPAPAEIDAFLADTRPLAYERLVERLLASPRYGERWARHWLDLARYSESQGFEYDRLRDHAWHYRDYVIRSFNADKPYDRFMMEQIAGDVLEPVTADGIIATSLLVCGPWDEAGNSQANATQRAVTREEEMEDLIGVVGQTFLGLTVHCARCHDHKFDPIAQKEYYQVKAVFDGVRHGERPVAGEAEARARSRRVAELEGTIAEARAVAARIEDEAWRRAWAQDAPESGPPVPRPWRHWAFAAGTGIGPKDALQGGATVTAGRLHLSGQGAYFESAPLDKDLREKTLEVWLSLADLGQGGGAGISIESGDGRVFDAIVFAERQPGKWTAGSDGFRRTQDLDAPVETATSADGVHLAAVYRADHSIALYRNGERYGTPYTPAAPLETFRAGDARVLLGKRHTGGGRPFLAGAIRSAAVYDRALSDEEVARAFRARERMLPMSEGLAHLTEAERAEREAAVGREARARTALEALPPVPVSYVGKRVQPAPTRWLRRGDVKAPMEEVVPAGLAAIGEVDAAFGLAADASEAERRLKFADWLADPRHPLPARVMANRVWHYHFGQGLVATPSDFGVAGARPTHPELLDWLAAAFIESGWSVKALHRAIVNSATYRQSSRYDPRAAAVDADGALWWRFPPRRLEAEAVRDAMLAVSGEINLRMGGPSFRPFEVLRFPANAYLPVDRPEPEFNRRTVYRMQVNSGKDPLLDALDCPDPSVKTPRRGTTTTPIQALALMNGPFTQRQAARLAERALRDAGEDLSGAVARAYRLALGRAPTEDEAARAAAVARERGLRSVCWALLNATEFVYVR